jgi:hypothetical protein
MAATKMAESGASAAQLKTKFGWKSEATANEYLESTSSGREQVAQMISGSKPAPAVPPQSLPSSSAFGSFGAPGSLFCGQF